MSRLKGRKALVTGAASGIGAATVARLLADGATVLACDISGEGMAGTFNHVANLADPQAITLLAAAAESQLGGLDILVNNAGVCPVGTLEDLTDDQWQFGLDVNLLAPARLAKACLPLLKASSAGRVINTGSILSRYGDAGLGAYASSKHAILGFTRSLAMELGPYGVTVNCVQPGCIVTGMTRGMLENGAAAEYYREKSALKRLGQPEDIADVIAFLASDDARFITGQGIIADGGVMTHS
ncbi:MULTISPECIES: SDR family oxidoreductase [Pseudomonadota]|jgi:NAD(P)-dependent dehydrogenase (short-subunit alcohol dehydrogenase family)|uniref:SDR family NAD(P)-dependent oxidoreductase n=1 Tax=Pseudomonadota TaxID=1224 RepID=UPI000769EC9A|nr:MULTISPECIES: SDR family oxidoreductase [Pseudomonadota]MAF62372.1 short-chain dehydrogenase [Blastomonas sp.]MBA4779697.1 SDR family oxidoreductase [Blastomonas sp.]|tara:strand:+ start:65581 stop:66303 length:723 start_codon:yes stop_codon:yes gene_type:complete